MKKQMKRLVNKVMKKAEKTEIYTNYNTINTKVRRLEVACKNTLENCEAYKAI